MCSTVCGYEFIDRREVLPVDHLFGEPLHKLLILLGHGAYLRLRRFLKPAAILRRATPQRDERADHRRAGSLGRELVTA